MKFTGDFNLVLPGIANINIEEHEIFCLLPQMTFNGFIVINVAFSYFFTLLSWMKWRSQCFHLILTLWYDMIAEQVHDSSDPSMAGVARECSWREKYGASQHIGYELLNCTCVSHFRDGFLIQCNFSCTVILFVSFLPPWRIQELLYNQAPEACSVHDCLL